MEAKKTPKADLEKRRGLYLEIGLVVISIGSPQKEMQIVLASE